MSDTRNVKLGVCKVTFGGVDLGYTKGGVDVSVKTTTHKVQVDQFGQSSVNEYILGREITAKVPLAETTVDNLFLIMPGASKFVTNGTKAAGSYDFGANPTAGDTIDIDGYVIKFVTAGATGQQVVIGAALTDTLTNLLTFVEAATDARLTQFTYITTASNLNLTAVNNGVEWNAAAGGGTIALSASNVDVTVVQMTGGVNDKKRADVQNGIGNSLLATAQPLVLHPQANAANDTSDDITIPLANTPGQADFAYKLDAERIFNVEFTGYPDPVTKLLFQFGDLTAGS